MFKSPGHEEPSRKRSMLSPFRLEWGSRAGDRGRLDVLWRGGFGGSVLDVDRPIDGVEIIIAKRYGFWGLIIPFTSSRARRVSCCLRFYLLEQLPRAGCLGFFGTAVSSIRRSSCGSLRRFCFLEIRPTVGASCWGFFGMAVLSNR